jgi:putative ATPase
MSLFDQDEELSAAKDVARPLAERLRPATLEDYIGQEHLLGEGKPLRRMMQHNKLSSMILWQTLFPSVP